MALPLQSIAIADDEPLLRTILEAMATDLKYRVTGTASNGSEAVELVIRTQPNLILLDVHMPVLDGLEAMRRIVTLGTTGVVLLTGDPDPEIARKGMDLGACGYIQKPFDGGQIGTILESAWHRFQTVAALQEKNRVLDETLELRKLTEKAKGILMEQQGFSEDEAHKCLLKLSQDQGLPMKEVCRSIIQVRTVLGMKKNKKIA